MVVQNLIFFYPALSSPTANIGSLSRDSLSNPMLISACFILWVEPRVATSLETRSVPKDQGKKYLVRFEPRTFGF